MGSHTYTKRLEPSDGHTRHLSPDVYACEVSGGAVFLNLRSLKYSALDAECLPLLRHAIHDWVPSDAYCPNETAPYWSTELLDALQAKGLLCAESSHRPYVSEAPWPTTACSPNWDLSASLSASVRMLLHIFLAYIPTVLYLRSGRLQSLLARLSSASVGRAELHPIAFGQLQALLTSFAKLRVWFYTSRDACLLDSIVLATVLHRHRINAALHIGVALMPFSAHAWVQVGPCALDDTVEHVCEYKSILVV